MVPVGGGSSVTGGIEAIGNSEDQPVVALDVTGLQNCIEINADNQTATFETEFGGPVLEKTLAQYGLTLGHIPQSFEYSTLGGWLATR